MARRRRVISCARRRIAEAVGALAGAALVVLVFLPWWAFDPLGRGQPEPRGVGLRLAGALGVVDLYAAPDASAWDALRNGAIIWIVTGALGRVALASPALGLTRPLRGLRFAALGAALVSLAIAVVRLADPPFAALPRRPRPPTRACSRSCRRGLRRRRPARRCLARAEARRCSTTVAPPLACSSHPALIAAIAVSAAAGLRRAQHQPCASPPRSTTPSAPASSSRSPRSATRPRGR